MDAAFEQNTSLQVSRIIYDRLKDAGAGREDTPEISEPSQRELVTKILRSGGPDLCRQIGIHWVDTTGVHDVTSGGQPFGDVYYSDLLSGLFNFGKGTPRVLDFGCSTGRVIRNLKSAFTNIEAWGCDPRVSSIERVSAIVPEVNWFTSPEAPPMNGPQFDIVFAISVWSHFSETRALEWFDEFAQLVKPAGRLIFSTHGYRSIFHFSKRLQRMPEEAAAERTAALNSQEFHFRRYPNSDLDAHWGMAFIPREWPRKRLTQNWIVRSFHPGLAMANQDVYVLERREDNSDETE